MVTYFSTPILLLIFNRPEFTQQVFNQIKIIKPQYLYVAADGPRPGRDEDKILCKKTREIINQVDWNCEVKTLFRDENLGCGFAVCSAISWFFEQVEEGIILEDDCLPDISFFPYCGELLTRYKNDENIYLISGTNMQNGFKRGEASYYFSHYPITWGWASWSRAWNYFVYDIPHYDQDFKTGVLDHVFQSMEEKILWNRKLEKCVTEKEKIWDFQWWFAIWKNKGKAIIPNANLIVNLGFRNIGSHTFLYDSIREPSISHPIQIPLVHPENMAVNLAADQFTYKQAFSHSMSRFFRLMKENGIIEVLRYALGKFYNNQT